MARLHGEGSGRRFTLLPFTAVGTASGLLLAVYSDYIELAGGGTATHCSRFRTARSATGGGYQALWGGEEGRSREKSAAAAAALDQSAQQPDKVMYIGGSDTLPQPLPRAEEAALIARLADSDPAARQTLIERNLRLVVYIARRFENTGINIEDLISIGTIGLIKAINTFRADKNIKLATYASRCIENEILMYLRKNSVPAHGGQSSTSRSTPTGMARSCC